MDSESLIKPFVGRLVSGTSLLPILETATHTSRPATERASFTLSSLKLPIDTTLTRPL